MPLFTSTRILCTVLVGAVGLGLAQPSFAGSGWRNRGGQYDRYDRGHARYPRRHESRTRISIQFGNAFVSTFFGPCCRRGYYREIWVNPVYATRYDNCGNPYQVMIQCGYTKKVWIPATCRNPNGYYHRRHNRQSRGCNTY